MNKTELAVRKHPLTDEISDERHLDSGIWVYLKHGNCTGETAGHHSAEGCVHAVHEDTWTKCLVELQRVLRRNHKCVDNY